MKTQHKHRQSNIEDSWAAMSGPFDLSGRLIEQQTEWKGSRYFQVNLTNCRHLFKKLN